MKTQGPAFAQKITDLIKDKISRIKVSLDVFTTKNYIKDDITNTCVRAGRKLLSRKLYQEVSETEFNK